jgi:hypothetical protein
MQTLTEKAQSFKEEERLQVADILGQVTIPNKVDLLELLLKDSSLEVKRVACKAASSIEDKRLYPILIENVITLHIRSAAFNSLVSLGTPVFEYIMQNFNHFLPDIQVEMVHLLGCAKDTKSISFLEKLLNTSHRRMLHKVLLSLKKRGYKATHSIHEVIKSLLESESKIISNLRESVNVLKVEKLKLVHDLLCREVELSQECCFLLLSFIYPGALIAKAQQGLLSGDRELRSHGIEILLQTLNKSDQKLLMKQVIYSPYKGDKKVAINMNKLESCLGKVAEYASNCFIPELLSAVIYIIGNLQLKNLLPLVYKHVHNREPLMKEMLAFSLNQLNSVFKGG